MDGQGCDYDRIVDGGSHRYSLYCHYCLYGKSIFQLRFIAWSINAVSYTHLDVYKRQIAD